MYSPAVGIVYVFNLIVGTGALTLPKAMASAGWLISIILLILLCVMSYITTTFMVESLSIANACLRHQKKENLAEDSEDSGMSSNESESETNSSPKRIQKPDFNSERTPLLHSSSAVVCGRSSLTSASDKFSITRAVEMGEMADMFFNKIGRVLFYLCVTIYLYGDLAIYAAAVPKSLRDIVCGNLSCDYSNHSVKPQDSDVCWGDSVSRMDVYRIFLAIFTVCLGPFAYFSVQKTKYLQILTTLFRWFAFGLMIILAIIHISRGTGDLGRPPAAEINGVPNLFGVSVYSFMCQHSLPSLVTPIKDKNKLSLLLAADYFLILIFYMLLGMTAIYCFPSDDLKDIYTLNFQTRLSLGGCRGQLLELVASKHLNPLQQRIDALDSCDATSVVFFRYFLGLFPVFTLSTNFPIISVTLRNNLKALFPKSSSTFVNRFIFPTLAIGPPIAIAFGTNNLTTLVGITGSYAGAGVQYVIPAFLVLMARKEGSNCYGRAMVSRNHHRSPFGRRLWVIIILSWAIVCLLFVTTNHILSLVQ